MIDQLTKAVYRKDYPALERLVADGADVNAVDEDGRTALMHAVLAADPDPKMVRVLIGLGADVNKHDRGQQWTALHFAARDQKEDIVGALLDSGAAIDAEDVFGNTPLWRCVMNRAPKIGIVRRLLAKGADPNRKNKHGVSPRDTAVNMGNTELTHVLQRGRSDD